MSVSKRLPFVSVIVPVYNDASRIGHCIDALLSQTYPDSHYEILIVDNGSTDRTADVIRKYSVIMLQEKSNQSSYAARNKGIQHAKGEVIAFTDADCIPASDWIERGVESLLRIPNCGLVAGRINPIFKDPRDPNAVEIYETVMHFRQERNVNFDKYGATANVVTYKGVFDNVGLFNDTLKSGGDNEWGRRVFLSGYEQVYADDTVVEHPTRYSTRQLHQRIARLTGGRYARYSSKPFFVTKGLLKSIKTLAVLFMRTLFGQLPEEHLKGVKRKIQFLLICLYVESVRNVTRIRLASGASPERV